MLRVSSAAGNGGEVPKTAKHNLAGVLLVRGGRLRPAGSNSFTLKQSYEGTIMKLWETR